MQWYRKLVTAFPRKAEREKKTYRSEGPLIGSDGLGYIATVDTTREEAEKITAVLNSQPPDAWKKFIENTN